MTADATLFTNNDLTEPGFGGQVIATSKIDKNFIPRSISAQRRIFININDEHGFPSWKDQYGYFYYFEELRDIVIVNRGLEK